jgi:cellulose synthase operon protein C
MTRTNNKLPFALALLGAFAFVQLAGSPSFEVPAAHAQAKKKDKKKKKGDDKKDDDKKADEEKSDEKVGDQKEKKDEKRAAEAPKEEKLRTTGPAQIKTPVATDSKIDLSAKADKKRDEAIKEIEKLLPKVKGEQKGELVFRLAELYWAKSRFLYNTEFKEFDEAYQKWVDGGREGKEPQLAQYAKKSDAYKKQALQNYAVVLEEFPDYPRLDEILYIMAFNEYEAGKKKEAVDNYSKLIRQYPKSEYVSDSYLALGEHYFGSNDLTKATKAYQKAHDKGREDKRPAVYRYALYKLAWCDYNAQSYKDALAKFKDVIKQSEGASGEKEAIQLKNEALNDMVLTYAQLDESKEAYDYFKARAGNEKAYNLSNKLAAVYKEQGKSALQIDTLRMLINLDPDHTQCPDYQSSIVQAYEKLGDRQSVRKEVTRLVELYRPASAWWRKNEGNKQNVERALTVAETRMRELVTDYHRYAQKFKKVDDYLVARDIYAQYLQAFPTSDSAYRLNFYYAELLWDIGEWRKAAGEYDNVVKRDAKGEYTRVCAYNAVLAWEKIVKGEKAKELKDGETLGCPVGDKKCEEREKKRNEGKLAQDKIVLEKLKKGGNYDPEKIPDDEVALANACDAYVNVVPVTEKADKALQEELIKVKFKAAYIFHSHNHFDEGAKRFGELIDRWPDSEQARTAADVTLDSYAAREQWDNLEKWSRTFAKNKSLMGDAKFASSVNKFMEGATFKSTMLVNEEATKIGKSDPVAGRAKAAEAATRFESFVEEFPKSEYAVTALYNSTLIYANANQIDLAIRASNKLLGTYAKEITAGDAAKEKLEEKVVLNLAAYHEKIADYPKAAETYVKFVDKWKTHEKAPDSLYNAGIFYLGLGDTKAATAAFARYIKDFPKQKDVPDVYLRIAAIYEDQDDFKRASAMYADFEKLHGKDAKPEQILTSRYKTAYMLQKAGRDKEMLEVCNGILGGWKKLDEKVRTSPGGQLAGGYCAYQTLEDEWQAYKKIKVEARGGGNPKKVLAQVGETLEQKKKKRDEMAKKYLDVLAYGNGEWGVAGLYRAAESLFDYVDTLRNAPDPPSLANNPEALDLFRTELENIAFPVEDQGIQALEKALDKAFELGIYSEYTIAIEDRLRKFKPARFGRIYEMPFFPNAAVSASGRTAQR